MVKSPSFSYGEELVPVPSTQIHNSNTRGVDAPSGLYEYCMYELTIPHIHINKNNIYLFTSI